MPTCIFVLFLLCLPTAASTLLYAGHFRPMAINLQPAENDSPTHSITLNIIIGTLPEVPGRTKDAMTGVR